MKLTFFKTQGPRQFHIKPRYYDPEKEAQEQRKWEREQRISGGEGLREQMERKWHRKRRKKSMGVTLVYLALIILLLVIILGS